MTQPLFVLAWTAFLVSGTPSSAPAEAVDFAAWRSLPVQDGGRHKPLDTLAWETLRIVGNRGSLQDPATGQRLEPTAAYLTLLFDWQGWEKPANPHSMMMGGRSFYFEHHQADKWDKMPLLRVDYLPLRAALGLAPSENRVSVLQLSEAEIAVPVTGEKTPFLAWAAGVGQSGEEGLTTLEQKGLELANRLWAYQDHRMGRRLAILPMQGSEQKEWASADFLLHGSLDDALDPTGKLRQAARQLRDARAAYQTGHAAKFAAASAAFRRTLDELGPKLGDYPERSAMDLEVSYNHRAPFRLAWILVLLALIAVLLALGTGWKIPYWGAIAFYGAGLLAALAGFAMRLMISGRAPVTNMYESVIYVGTGVAALGLVFELIYRKKAILAAAAVVSTLALILADNCPALLDPSLGPLQPVLRSNFWLTTHVLTITLSYAAFALAMGIAHVTLGFYLFGAGRSQAIAALSRFTYRLLQIGVLLLAVGTILGGVWADYAWGRFWGWDPKEVWALIALLGYLALLHARYTGWVGHFGLAVSTIGCFALVIVAWYGVNFVLGTGLHSYGFGGGGAGYVGSALGLQLLYVLAAAIRYLPTRSRDDVSQPARHAALAPDQAVG